ncbi:MAG: RagB/SusD family nutrient uptake outer membrane protein [Leeuwenhoekiella sp.]
MKGINKYLFLLTFSIFSCSDAELDVANPNSPTFDAVETESGLNQLASGVYAASGNFYHWITFAYHEAMGDAIYIPWGNWSFRWVNQPTSITLDDGTVITPPQEGAQGESLELRNTRTQGTDNAFANPWRTMYATNNSSNLILRLVETTEFSGDAETKKSVYRAWGYFWKGYVYSRIGSLYTAGLIIDEANTTNNNYVSNEDILTEAAKNFELAKDELNSISGSITAITSSIIPSNLVPSSFRGQSAGTTLTKEGWIRNINTMLARNILVNTKVSNMTSAQWDEILELTNQGLQPSDYVFVMKQDGNNYEITTTVNARVSTDYGWHFLSERLVQDFKEGDDRYVDNVQELSSPQVNRSGRGIHYGTRWGFITDADYAVIENDKANIYYAGTYEENQLMRAEALMYTGQVDQGLSIVDAVREYQEADLEAVSGTDITLDGALEELRVERRIGLLLRGVSFYDARRWDVTKEPQTGLVVLDGSGNLNTDATFNYNYLDYWSVPDQELVFNEPSENSVTVISPN